MEDGQQSERVTELISMETQGVADMNENQQNQGTQEDSQRSAQGDVGDMQEERKHPITPVQEMVADLITAAYERFRSKPSLERLLLTVGILLVLATSIATNILSQIYYAKEGHLPLFVGWVEITGWPVLLLFFVLLYKVNKTRPALPLSYKYLFQYIMLAILGTSANLLTILAYRGLPTSLVSLLGSTSLIFTTVFGYLLAENKLYVSTLNAVILITGPAIILATDSSLYMKDDNATEDNSVYIAAAIGGSVLRSLAFAIFERIISKLQVRKREGIVKYIITLEYQMVVSFISFVFMTPITMIFGTAGLGEEASKFKKQSISYPFLLIGFAISSQLNMAGNNLIILLASTVTVGFADMLDLIVSGISSIIIFNDRHTAHEIIAILLCIWGFLSHILGSSDEHFWTEVEDDELAKAVIVLYKKGSHNHRDKNKASFKAGYCVVLADAMESALQGHCINPDQICIRLQRFRKQVYATQKMLRNTTLFKWDSERSCVTCTNEGTQSFNEWIKKNKYAWGLLKTPFPHYHELKRVFGYDREEDRDMQTNSNTTNAQENAAQEDGGDTQIEEEPNNADTEIDFGFQINNEGNDISVSISG